MAGLSLCLVLVVAGIAWAALRDDTYRAPTPSAPSNAVDPEGASSALRRLLDAVRDDRPGAAARLAPAGDPTAADRLRTVVTNAARIGVTDVDLRYVTERGGVDDQGRWRADVQLAWRYAGFDESAGHSDVTFEFADTPDGVDIVGVGGAGRVPVWLQGPVQVSRSDQVLVVAARDLARYTHLARVAVPVVRRVLPQWRSGLVVEVPDSPRDLGRALDAHSAGEYANIAAVTATVDGTLGAGAPVHVFVNPRVFGGLRAQGAQVVMSHEAVHVATGAATSAGPLWLIEGFADYVALRDVDLPDSTTAGQIARVVRRHGAPDHLPTPDDFDTRTTHLGATYEAAWLACRELARRSGEQALVEFYDRMRRGDDEGTTFRQVFGESEAAFTQQWRTVLEHLAG